MLAVYEKIQQLVDEVKLLKKEIAVLKEEISWMALSQHIACTVLLSHEDEIQFCVDEVGLLWGRLDNDSKDT